MKALFFIVTIALSAYGFAQPQKMNTCTGLPVANPTTKATISVDEVTKYFETSVSEKLKKGTHSAVFKLLVDCNGDVVEVIYQRGTFINLDQEEYKTKMYALKWKSATHKSKAVSSFVFVSLEIVNGKFTVVVQ